MQTFTINSLGAPHVLVVDDEQPILNMIQKGIRSKGYQCSVAQDAKTSLNILKRTKIDVVVTDIGMPGMSGIELTRIIKNEFATDVIIMTGFINSYTYDKVIEEGASDFLQKPIHMKEFLMRLQRVIKDRQNAIERCQIEAELKQSLDGHRRTIEGIIQIMALTIEVRDPYTAGHQNRVAKLACAIAKEMHLSKDQIDQIYMAGIIHDIGKIAVPAEILSKPTQLTEFEFGIVKSHPKVAYDLLKTIEFPWPLDKLVFQHHEKLDGSGYPQGLCGNEILLEAQIITIADVVEAIASHRPYRPALGLDFAIKVISEGRGTQFNKDGVDACIKILKENEIDLSSFLKNVLPV